MEINQTYPMEKSVKIMRISISVFLQNYIYLTTSATFVALPLAALALISDSFYPFSPLFRVVFSGFMSLFDAVGFPRSSEFFSFLGLKISQTIATSFLIIPFTLTFLLLSKSCVTQVLSDRKYSFFSVYKSLFITQICNILIIFSANATFMCLLFLIFSCVNGFGLWTANSLVIFSAIGGVLYSIILANALIICNLALTLSGMESRGGFLSILKACVLIKGKTSTALSLALSVHLLFAGVEALFNYRVIQANYYRFFGSPISFSTALEVLLIVYMYSIILILDSVITCLFYKSCQTGTQEDRHRINSCWIEIQEKDDNHDLVQLKRLDHLP